MRRAGTVVGGAQGVAIVRAPDDRHPDIGTDVVDERLTQVGRVVDVFGPVDRPYLVVSPARDTEVAGLLGKTLYDRSD